MYVCARLLCKMLFRWLTGRHLASVDVMVPRVHSGLVHKGHTQSVIMILMDATWSLRFMAGTFRYLVYSLLCIRSSKKVSTRQANK